MRRLALPAALLLAGCAGPQDFLRTGGRAARELAAIGWPALLGLALVTVLTWALIFWVALRRRGSFDEHAPAEAGGGQRWILVGGVALPVAVLSVLFISTLGTLSNFPMAHAAMDEPDIRVTGHQWWFDVTYLPGGSICGTDESTLGKHPAALPEGERSSLIVHSPSEVHIPVGVPVEIELETHDVIHSFWVPKLHGKVDLIPGQKNRVRIQADRPGVYEGECAEFCGVQHAHMRLIVVAHTPGDYIRWLNHQREAASVAAAEPQVQIGRAVFERAACALCHTVRGTAALGQVGPELTHVGARQRIAGGTLPNTTANLQAWVTDAQSLKPGAGMPSLRQFTGSELRALVAYLQNLR
jgi:cytochrome c oxidase subunit II